MAKKIEGRPVTRFVRERRPTTEHTELMRRARIAVERAEFDAWLLSRPPA